MTTKPVRWRSRQGVVQVRRPPWTGFRGRALAASAPVQRLRLGLRRPAGVLTIAAAMGAGQDDAPPFATE